VRKLFNTDGSLKLIHELDDVTAAAIASIEVDEIKADGVVIGQVKKTKYTLLRSVGYKCQEGSKEDGCEGKERGESYHQLLHT